MSTTLEHQIHEFATALLEDVATATAESVVVRPLSPAAEQIRRVRPAWLAGPALAAVSFAAVVVIVVISSLAFTDGATSPADDPVARTAGDVTPTTEALLIPESTPTTLLARVPVFGEIDWVPTRVPIDAVTAVSAGDRIYVIGEGFNSIASTTDGRVWTSQTVPAVAQTPGDRFAAWEDIVVTAGGGGGVRYGGTGSITWSPYHLTIWNAETQQITQREFANPSDDLHGGVELAFGVGGKGVLVVMSGSHFDPEDLVIQEYGRDDYVEIGETGGKIVVRWEDGTVDTLSLEGIDVLGTNARGWLTTDGLTWIPIPDMPVTFRHVVGFADGFMGIAYGQAWYSEDGITWERVSGSSQAEWSTPTAAGSGVSFAAGSNTVTVDRFGYTSNSLPASGQSQGFERPIVTSGAGTIAVFDLLEETYSYRTIEAEWITGHLPDGFPDADLGGRFTNVGAVTDDVMLVGVYHIGAESFADIDWWVTTIP